jgi:hypothetical protein
MSAHDLTTVANVKTWLGLPLSPTPSDATLAGLVVAASRTIYATLSRSSLLPQSYAETIDLESDRVYLANWPVQQVTSVILDGLAVPPAGAPPSLGYWLQPSDGAPPGRPQALVIFGRRYHRRRQSLVVAYQAGYAIEAEACSAPSASPYLLTAAAPFGAWARDLGVTYANSGVPLSAVNGAPAAGQYAVNLGVYQFNAADAGAALSLPRATCHRTWRRRRRNSPPNASAPPSASACARNRSAARRRSPTTFRGSPPRWRR